MSETTPWEDRYQKGDMPWEKGEAAPPLAEFLERHSFSGKILVPGCGYGHDVRLLACQGAEVIGMDLAPSAIQGASRFPRTGKESYQQANFFELPVPLHGTFDGIWEHTCFCAISPADRPQYVAAAARALRPGGIFLGIFYLTPDAETGPPFGSTLSEIESLFQLEFTEMNHWKPERSYPGREGRELLIQWRRRSK